VCLKKNEEQYYFCITYFCVVVSYYGIIFIFATITDQEKLSVADHAAILRSDGSVASIHGGRPKQGIKIKLTR